jgi:hypothetical protein
MADRTITGTYGALFTLSNAGDNPGTILASAQLDAGLHADTTAEWAVISYGAVRSVGTVGMDRRRAGARPMAMRGSRWTVPARLLLSW